MSNSTLALILNNRFVNKPDMLLNECAIIYRQKKKKKFKEFCWRKILSFSYIKFLNLKANTNRSVVDKLSMNLYTESK